MPLSESIADPVMTLDEIAGYLKVSEKTIVRMVQAGELPAFKVSNQWRFLREAIEGWLTAQMQRASGEYLAEVVLDAREVTAWEELLTPGRVILDLRPAASKREVLAELAAPLLAEGVVADAVRYVDALAARESMLSTAIGDGMAVPHARYPERAGLRRNAIVVGVCPEGMDFDALDRRPTHLFFLIGATSTEAHLHLMARLMRVLRGPGVKDDLQAAVRAGDVCSLLTQAADACREEACVSV